MSPLPFCRTLITGILLTVCLLGTAWAKVDRATRYLERSVSLRGPTGWINIPSASIAESGKLSAGIHNGEAKLNIGLLDMLEGGVYFEADRLGARFEPYRDLSSMDRAKDHLSSFVKEAFTGQAKLKLLDQDWGFVSLAAGLEDKDYYVVAQRYFPNLSRVTLLAGWGNGRFEKGFVGLSKTIFSGAEIMFEHDGEGVNIGLRMLLAPNLIMNLAGKDLTTIGEVENLGEVIGQHLFFGITYVERVW